MTVVLVAGLPLLAGGDDRPLLERVTNPDLERNFKFPNKTYQAPEGVHAKPAATGLSPYPVKDFRSRAAPEPKSFLGIKNPWFGKKIAETREVDSALISSASDRLTRPDRNSTQSSHSQTESYPITGYQTTTPIETTDYKQRGSRQGALDAINNANRKELTVEDIRKILNRSTD